MTCEFPTFLQSPEKNGILHPWNTRRWWLHLRHQPKWAEKQHIFVQGSFMWRRRDMSLKACQKGQRRRSFMLTPADIHRCTEQQLVYNRTCVSSEGDGKFRVLQYNSDRFILSQNTSSHGAIIRSSGGNLFEETPHYCRVDSVVVSGASSDYNDGHSH